MSKTYLLSDNYSSTKESKGEYFGPNENILPSISNSFIQKQSVQMKNTNPSNQYQRTMPPSHSKKVSDNNKHHYQLTLYKICEPNVYFFAIIFAVIQS